MVSNGLAAGPADQSDKEMGESAPALVARQPVFDHQGRVWGYELLFRDASMQPGLAGKSSSAATSTVMIDGFELMRPFLRPKQRFLINFATDFLEAGIPAMLPPDICTIEILESVEPTEKVLAGLTALKQKGYMLALDDYVGQEELRPFLPLVDIVKVDVLHKQPEAIGEIVKTLEDFPGKMLAEKVEDSQTANFCRTSGFAFFQGFFYSKAEVVWGKKLNPSQMTKTKLLSLSASSDPDMKKISQAISADVYLTFKLLKFINSLYFGLPTQVRSVEHALSLMGSQRVKQWLCVTALAEMDSTPMSQEIVFLSAQRAKFLELLASNHPASKLHGKEYPAKLFITGLFSMLESMLRLPLTEIFSSIALDKDVMQVLCDKTGPLSSWYELMTSYEQGHWEEVKEHARKLGILDSALASAYIDAGSWATYIFGTGTTRQEFENKKQIDMKVNTNLGNAR